MKLASIGKMAAIAGALAFGFNAPSALAHKVVHVQGTLYVIVCEPGGQAFTFNGSSGGAGDVAGILCPSAAVASGGAGVQVIEAQSAELAIKTRGTSAQRGQAGGGATHNCPTGTHWYEPAKACVANGGHPSL